MIRTLILLAAGLATCFASAQTRDLFVSSETTNSVKRYDGATGAYKGDFVTAGSGGLGRPQGILFGPDGNLYVSSAADNTVKKYNGSTGAFTSNFVTSGNLIFPADLSVHQNKLYVAEFNNPGRIATFSLATGMFLGNATGATNNPYADGHVIDPVRDLLWVSSSVPSNPGPGMDGSIRKYRLSTGQFLGIHALGSGLRLALDLRVGPGGDLFVNSYGTGNVKRFDGTTGVFEGDFITGLGQTQGQEITPDGSLLVGSYSGSYLNKYNANTGAFLGTIVSAGSGGLAQPNNFVFGPVPEPGTALGLSAGALALWKRLRR